MALRGAFRMACSVAALVLILVGAAFLAAPDQSLALADHDLNALPQVMGGRYVSYGLILAAVLWRRDWVLLAAILGVFGLVGLIDAAIYWRGNPLPHLIAAGAAFAAAALAYAWREAGR